MYLTQTGYLLNEGPVFVNGDASQFKVNVVIVQGTVLQDGSLRLTVKPPSYANVLRPNGFPYEEWNCTTGSYYANQVIQERVDSYRAPKVSFGSGYKDFSNTDTSYYVTAIPTNPVATNPTPTNPTQTGGGGQTTPVQTNPTVTNGNTVYQSATPQLSQQGIAIGLGVFAFLLLLLNNRD